MLLKSMNFTKNKAAELKFDSAARVIYCIA